MQIRPSITPEKRVDMMIRVDLSQLTAEVVNNQPVRSKVETKTNMVVQDGETIMLGGMLFQKDIGGLEVQDAEGAWHPVAPENDAIVINTGDLMERWTNGKYRSTPHRVQPKQGDVDRYSIAVFVDPDTQTPVKVLDSCLEAGERPNFPEVTAGEHIQERIRASHGS